MRNVAADDGWIKPPQAIRGATQYVTPYSGMPVPAKTGVIVATLNDLVFVL